MSTGWGTGSTRAWRRMRFDILTRDKFLCRAHPEGHCAGAAEHLCRITVDLAGDNAGHAHHTRGKALGDDPQYLITACAPCNLAIGEPAEPDVAPRPRTKWL